MKKKEKEKNSNYNRPSGLMGKIGISPNQLLSKNGTKMTEDQNVKITSNTKSAEEM